MTEEQVDDFLVKCYAQKEKERNKAKGKEKEYVAKKIPTLYIFRIKYRKKITYKIFNKTRNKKLFTSPVAPIL